ncbi:MAG: class I SAM-dependent rRNA methyltransferase [Deltaproteobacteria bacterium]|nr:class I SAM-dependent rRNA methyltransferase [Deltaproteobacteria bacterium]
MREPVVRLQRGRDRSTRRRHPWVFSGAVASVEGEPAPGATVVVAAHDGTVLGRAAYSPSSQIRLRLWTFDEATPVDDALLHARLDAALALRKRLVLTADTDCARLVFAEADGLPGLVADLYGDTLVVQCHSAGAERIQDVAIAHLRARTGAARVVLRSDAEVRKLEGLEPRSGVVFGPPIEGGLVRAREHGMQFLVDVERGHKTGFYLDQRDSRARVRAVARGRVLNCFSYTGGFAVAALSGGAEHALSVDTSLAALELAEKNVADNGIDPARHDGLRGDCFDVLRGLYDEGERFDLVVLDPPKFAPAARHVAKAARGYKDLALRALKLLHPGGLLFSFSCSGAIDRALFRQIAASAALEAQRPLTVLGELGHPPDHPVPTSFAEGEYLKGYWALAQ